MVRMVAPFGRHRSRLVSLNVDMWSFYFYSAQLNESNTYEDMKKYEANSPVCAGPRSCTAPWAAACRWALARGAARGWSQCRRSARARCRTTPAAPTPARTPSYCDTAPPPAYRHRDQTQSQSSYQSQSRATWTKSQLLPPQSVLGSLLQTV